MKRLVMRVIAKRAGGDTDTSRDYVYTDWEALERFAGELAEELEPAGHLKEGKVEPSMSKR